MTWLIALIFAFQTGPAFAAASATSLECFEDALQPEATATALNQELEELKARSAEVYARAREGGISEDRRQELLGIENTIVDRLMRLALVYENAGQPAEAEKYFQKGLERSEYVDRIAQLRPKPLAARSLDVERNPAGALPAIGQNVAEYVAKVRAFSDAVASDQGWIKDRHLSKLNRRAVYQDPKSGRFYTVDTRHGRWEVFSSGGGHMGEVLMNLEPVPNSIDYSGQHGLITR